MRAFSIRAVAVVWMGLLTAGFIGYASAQKPPNTGMEKREAEGALQGRFCVSVDPRMELLAVVQHFTSWAPGGHIKSKTTYKSDIDDYFGEFENHPAVSYVDSLVKAGFTHDAPVRFMLYHRDPPELSQHTPYSDYLINRAGGEQILAGLIDALRDFASETDFMGFYRAHRSLYDVHVGEVKSILGEKDYVRALEDFFGESSESYNVILPPLFAGGYGPAIKGEEGYDLYAVIGPCALEGDRAAFACLSYLESIMIHEWSHSFVNPLVDQYYDMFSESAALFDPIHGLMSRQAYPTWRVALYEHIVRACEINIRAGLYEGFDEDNSLQVQEGKGFWYVTCIDSLLDVYQTHREQYSIFSQFVPVIAAGLGELSVEQLPERITTFSGPLSGIFSRTDCIYLVYPTDASEEIAHRLREDLQSFVGFLSSFQMKSHIMSDKEALETSWKDKVAFIYGNSNSNLFLKQLRMVIPVSFHGDAVELGDQRYEGEGILLISCMPNPFNKMLPFAVCAANRLEDLIGIGSKVSSPSEWNADYVLYRGDERIHAGRYRKERGKWTLAESENGD